MTRIVFGTAPALQRTAPQVLRAELRPGHENARLIVETDEYCSFVDGLSFGHDRICREGFIGPA